MAALLHEEATCAEHPGAVASEACFRCGVFCCAGCLRRLDGVPLCGRCIEVRRQGEAVNELARAAAFYGALTFALPPLGLVGLFLGLLALARLARLPAEERARHTRAPVLALAGIGLPLILLSFLVALLVTAALSR